MNRLDDLQYEADRLTRLLDAAGTFHGERRDENVVGAMISIAEDMARGLAKGLEEVIRIGGKS